MTPVFAATGAFTSCSRRTSRGPNESARQPSRRWAARSTTASRLRSSSPDLIGRGDAIAQNVAVSPTPALRRAVRLCVLTVGWNAIVGGLAVATAVSTGSLSLIGFGINAVVDSSASIVLVWRFRAEIAGHLERARRAEQLALRLAGAAFLLIALYLLIQSTRALAAGRHEQATAFGIAEASAALLVLPVLASAKYSLSERLSSLAL